MSRPRIVVATRVADAALDRLRERGDVVDVSALPRARWDDALALIKQGRAHPEEIISHRMKLDDAERGYELFEKREALKVVLTPHPGSD